MYDGKYKYLEQINSPDDLKAIPKEDIGELCDEIRCFLINIVGKNGGHLASNLGVVELSVALHREFNCPHDHIIFDVGHQSYIHKILTGRFESFDTLRKGGGISGFTRRSESKYDCFGTGHSSTSLSAGLGFAISDKLSGSDAYTVVVMGDGAFTGGMIHEALNNCRKDLKLIIILNENEMSISRNIGRFARNIAKMRRKSGYIKAKKFTATVIKKIPVVGEKMFSGFVRIKKTLKNAMYGSIYFEDMGLYYLGPADGNNYDDVESLIREAKRVGESVVIHIKTKKGKGYAPAEKNPCKYHGLSPKCNNAEISVHAKHFSAEFGEYLTKLADSGEKICAITAAMSSGTGLDSFSQSHNDRFFDVGIAEEHAVTFAAGLAANGYKAVVAIYSTFLQRAYDQIIHDVALQNLPVLFCIDRAGLNPSDGATHHGMFDVAFLSQIPGMKIYTPATFDLLRRSIDIALTDNCPSAIRYPNGGEEESIVKAFYSDADDGKIGVRCDFKPESRIDVLLVTHGKYAKEVLEAENILKKKYSCGTVLCEYIKPYDDLANRIKEIISLSSVDTVIFAEEEIKAGGFGMMLSEELRKNNGFLGAEWGIVATDESFVIQDKDEPIYKSAHVSSDDIVELVEDILNKRK